MLLGCEALLPLLKTVQQVQYLNRSVQMAEYGANSYFARHPNLERQQRIDEAIRRVRISALDLEAAIASEQGDVQQLKNDLRCKYSQLRVLLETYQVMSAVPPQGGAETEAPKPVPFRLPEAKEIF